MNNKIFILGIIALMIIPIAFGADVKIFLQSADNETVADTYTDTNDNVNTGAQATWRTFSVGTDRIRTWIMYNMTPISSQCSNINGANFSALGFDVTSNINISLYEVNTTSINGAWNELSITGQNNPCGTSAYNNGSVCNQTVASSILTSLVTPNMWYNWTVTNIVQKAFNENHKNVSFILGDNSPVNGNQFYSKEAVTPANRPILYVSCNATVAIASSTSANLTLTAIDYFNLSSIKTFTAILGNGTSNVTYTTTNGTIPISNLTSMGYYNITFTSIQDGGYFNLSYLNFNISSNSLQAIMWQSVFIVNATEQGTTNIINSFGITVNGSQLINLSNSTGYATFKVRAGTYNITGNSSGYLNITNLSTITNAAENYLTLGFGGSSTLRIDAKSIIDDSYLTNFTINLRGVNVAFNSNKSTSSGNITFAINNGSYLLNFSAPSFNIQTFIFNFSFGNTSPNYTFSVSKLNSLNFSFWDEIKGKAYPFQTTTNNSISVELASDLFSSNYSTINSTLFLESITPGNYRITYSANTYRTRSYYFTLSPQTYTSLDLYLLSTTNGTLTTFTINDQNSNPFQNITLKALRYYSNSNSYETIAMAKTDAQGQAEIDLQQNNAFYKFLVVSSTGTILQDTIPATVFATAYTLRVTTGINNYADIKNRNLIFQTLTFSNLTNSYSITYNNLNGLGVNTCLLAYELTLNGGELQVCESCSTSGSATLVCSVNSSYMNNRTTVARAYTYSAIGSRGINATAILLDELIITPNQIAQAVKNIFGTFGVFMGFLIFITMTLIGLWNPIVALVLGTMGFVIANLMGFMTLGISSIQYLVGIVLLAGIIVYRSRA